MLRREWTNRNSHSLVVGMQNGVATLEDSLVVSYIVSSHILAVKILGIHPQKLKIYVHMKTCIQVFIAVLFTIVKSWKQP